MTIKIAKYLSECGIASRRKSETLVQQGFIFINGHKMTNVAARIDPQIDKIEYQRKIIKPEKFVYYLLNKPVGYTSTTQDPHAKKIIISLVPNDPKIWPVGRLDKYTSGLILLTNDGKLTQKMTHPSYAIEKEYEITINYPLSVVEIQSIKNGLHLEDGFIKPDHFEKIANNAYRIIIHSGKKRVVRRLIEKVGKNVSQLKRVRVGSLTLQDLQPGKWRPLAENEIKNLNS